MADGTVNSESLVRFETNDYSVPVRYAHRKAIVIATVDEVRFVYEDRLLAGAGIERGFCEPVHYRALLEQYSLEEVTAGVEYAIDIGRSDSDSIGSVVEHRADGPVRLFSLDGRPHLACVHGETTPVAAYQVLLEEVAS